MNINKHIEDNLDYYLRLPSPEHAFLLCGEWGVGKTYFIDEYIEKKSTESIKLIKISLFGIKTTTDINAAIFQKLHPLLGSKGARLAGNIIKGAFSMGVRLDINSDGTNESTLNTKLDKLNFFDFLSEKKDKEIALIFDDLERSNLSTTEMLGFINETVENSQTKVILIANEKPLIERDEEGTYKKFKEKVVGKTFEVSHDFNDILSKFLEGYSFEGYKDIIHHIYIRSKIKNLRKIKQSISDFEYLISKIDEKYKKNDHFHKELIRCFFALSIEVKKGNLLEEDLRKNIPFKKNTAQTTPHEDIHTKYFIDQPHLYNGNIWADIIFKGDTSTINEETSKLAMFITQTEKKSPSWLKLWNFRELEEEEFSTLIKEIENELKSLIENELITYLHKIALAIYFSKNNLIEFNIAEIKNIANEYIKKHKNSDQWKTTLISGNSYYNGTGYGYYDDQDEDFLSIKNMIIRKNKEEYDKAQQEAKKLEARKIVDSILSNIDSGDALTHLLLSEYEYKSILDKIDPKDFSDALISAKNASIGKISKIISERYSQSHFLNNQVKSSYFQDELEFWKGVQEELPKRLPIEQKLKSHILSLFLSHTVSSAIRLLSKR